MVLSRASSLIPVLVLASLTGFTRAREFTDDRGVNFTWSDENGTIPTIVVNAEGGLALFQLGMTSEQILGIWDKWIIRGSDIDLNSDDLTSYFAADPNREEVDFLKSVQDLTPGCSSSNEGCGVNSDGTREFDVDLLTQLAPDFVVYLHHGPYPEITDLIRQSTGKDPIFIDNRFENNDGCFTNETFVMNDANCYARSAFEVIQRTQDLATFLGVSSSDQVLQDQQDMCQAANEFTLMAEQLHSRGVRCLGATARMTDGGNVNLININQNVWLRTFEELGLPLLHPPLDNPTDFTKTFLAQDWFPGCDRTGSSGYNCDGIPPILPGDCWLFDSRSYPVVVDHKNEILEVLSVEAIKQDQFSSLLMNDGAVSYRTAAAIFREVTEDLKDAQRLHDETTCTKVDVTSREQSSLAFGGLQSGEFACYDRATLNADLLTCPEGFTAGGAPTGEPQATDSNGDTGTTDATATNAPGQASSGSSGEWSWKTGAGLVFATASALLELAFV